MSKPKAKRKWFQLHLSTCVMLMLMLGGIGWINFSWPQIIYSENTIIDTNSWSPRTIRKAPIQPKPGVFYTREEHFGWPLQVTSDEHYVYPKNGVWVLQNKPSLRGMRSMKPVWFGWLVLANIGVALVACGLCTIFLESHIRRRERKQEAAA